MAGSAGRVCPARPMISDTPERELFSRRDDRDARAELARRYDYLAQQLARKFRGRGTALDDLVQVARFGLVNAIDRFDPDRGVKFSTFAGRTIVGEIKHHFRGHAWSMRVPRSLQNLWLRGSNATDELGQILGRMPTIDELAEHLDVSEDEVLEALDAGGTMRAASLDKPIGEGGGTPMADLIGADDRSIGLATTWVEIEDLLEELDDRERTIVYLRFFEDRTQLEIANHIGVSQVHVSRILRSTLDELRERLETR